MTTTTPVRLNPTTWSLVLGYDQGQLRPAPARVLTVAGQGPLDEQGRLLHEGDVAAQLALALQNVETVLAAGGMDLRDVLRLTVHTTDVDAVLAARWVLAEPLAALGATPPTSVLGVTRLAVPGMAVLIDVHAAR